MSDRGRLFFGADRAAQRIRDHFSMVTLAECLQCYDCSHDEEPGYQEAVTFGLNAIMESSPLLLAACQDPSSCKVTDEVLLAEFDETRERLFQEMDVAEQTLLLTDDEGTRR